MILSDHDIKKVIKEGKLIIEPFEPQKQIGPASIDLRLGPEFKVFNVTTQYLLDIKKGFSEKDLMTNYTIKDGEPFILHPNNFVLCSTKEYVSVADNMVLRVEGKSTLARMGILVHTAGFVDPGFEGSITLEISNQSNLPVTLYAGMFICQVAVEFMSSSADVPYNKRGKSLYHHSKGPRIANVKNLF